MLLKKGKTFPGGNEQPPGETDYAGMISLALQKQLGTSHQAIKTAMRWTGAGERTVKNWFSGAHGPSGEHLIALARHSDEVLNIFLMMADRRIAVARIKIAEARTKLADDLETVEMLLADGT
ncbi:MAG: hypothetical protein LDL39_06260 [Magnetospirillum sp.]|nr:hypothetical protein [Magnetospirillum sp.]